MAKKLLTDAARFERTISRETSGCWRWLNRLDRDGYGHFFVGSRTDQTRRRVGAHRFAYEMVHGPIGAGMVIDHLCRNRACVNPGHLEVVTVRVNTLRGHTIQATNANKTHCKRGHPFDEANTRWIKHTRKSGVFLERRCRTCAREALQASRKKAHL